MRRRLLTGIGVLGVLFLVLNVVSAFIATRPSLQARLFGRSDREPGSPEDAGLSFERVDYGKDLWGWWIPAKESKGVVILIHGFGTSGETIRFSSNPLIPFAAALSERRYSSFVINLGYVTGAHHYTGGRSEAADIAKAVEWSSARRCGPVVVWGFSAGGHDALIAAAKTKDIVGVAADSAFVNTGEVVKQQAAIAVHLPRGFLSLTPWLFPVFGGKDIDVGNAWEHARRKPTLIIHGTADSVISPSNARHLVKATDGELWMVEGADHVDAYKVETAEYLTRATAFLARATALGQAPTGGCNSVGN